MKIVLDTNVLLSGLFFGGQPLRIVEACLNGRVRFVISAEIWAEYEQAATELAKDRPLPALPKLLLQLAAEAFMIEAAPFRNQSAAIRMTISSSRAPWLRVLIVSYRGIKICMPSVYRASRF